MENSEVAWLDKCASSFETSELLLGCVEQGEGLRNTESETQGDALLVHVFSEMQIKMDSYHYHQDAG